MVKLTLSRLNDNMPNHRLNFNFVQLASNIGLNYPYPHFHHLQHPYLIIATLVILLIAVIFSQVELEGIWPDLVFDGVADFVVSLLRRLQEPGEERWLIRSECVV